jgi:hypothetical protein
MRSCLVAWLAPFIPLLAGCILRESITLSHPSLGGFLTTLACLVRALSLLLLPPV